MNEKYVTDLDISRKLRELGVKQESEFYWCEWVNSGPLVNSLIDIMQYRVNGVKPKKVTSAFIADELLEMLPLFTYDDLDSYNLRIEKLYNGYSAKYIAVKGKKILLNSHHYRFPDTLGYMLVDLVERGSSRP